MERKGELFRRAIRRVAGVITVPGDAPIVWVTSQAIGDSLIVNEVLSSPNPIDIKRVAIGLLGTRLVTHFLTYGVIMLSKRK